MKINEKNKPPDGGLFFSFIPAAKELCIKKVLLVQIHVNIFLCFLCCIFILNFSNIIFLVLQGQNKNLLFFKTGICASYLH